jgi:hypothetical protein
MTKGIRDRLEALFEVARLLASEDDLDALMERILSEVHGVMNAGAASLLLRVPGTDFLEFVETRGSVAKHLSRKRLKFGEGISGEIALKRELINVVDAYQDERFNPAFDKAYGFRTKQILGAPMVFRESVVGVMLVMNKLEDTAFDTEDEQIMRIFCDQASVAVINAQERRRFRQKNLALEIFAREVGEILSNKLTLVYGYIHQVKRITEKHPIYSQDLPFRERFAVPVIELEKSTATMAGLAKTMNTFANSVKKGEPGLLHCADFLSEFQKASRYHDVPIYSNITSDISIRVAQENIVIILESLIQLVRSFAVKPTVGDLNAGQSNIPIIIVRERVDRVDFFVCLPLEASVGLSEEDFSLGGKGNGLLSMASVQAVADIAEAEIIPYTELHSNRNHQMFYRQSELLAHDDQNSNLAINADLGDDKPGIALILVQASFSVWS